MTDFARLWDTHAELRAMVVASGARAMETQTERDREMVRLLNRAHSAVGAAASFRLFHYVPEERAQAGPE